MKLIDKNAYQRNIILSENSCRLIKSEYWIVSKWIIKTNLFYKFEKQICKCFVKLAPVVSLNEKSPEESCWNSWWTGASDTFDLFRLLKSFFVLHNHSQILLMKKGFILSVSKLVWLNMRTMCSMFWMNYSCLLLGPELLDWVEDKTERSMRFPRSRLGFEPVLNVIKSFPLVNSLSEFPPKF